MCATPSRNFRTSSFWVQQSHRACAKVGASSSGAVSTSGGHLPFVHLSLQAFQEFQPCAFSICLNLDNNTICEFDPPSSISRAPLSTPWAVLSSEDVGGWLSPLFWFARAPSELLPRCGSEIHLHDVSVAANILERDGFQTPTMYPRHQPNVDWRRRDGSETASRLRS